MNTRLTLLTASVAVACFGVGVVLGGKGRSRRVAEEPSKVTSGASVPRISALSVGGSVSAGARDMATLVHSNRVGIFRKLRGYVRLIGEAEVEEIPDLMQMLSSELPGDMGGDALLEMLAKRWVEVDPMGAFEGLLAVDPPALSNWRSEVIAGALAVDPVQAWRRLLNLKENEPTVIGGALTHAEERSELADVMVSQLLSEDRALAIKLMTSTQNTGRFASVFTGALEELAKLHPALALDTLGELGLDTMRGEDVIATAFQTLAEEDRDAAIARFGELEGEVRNPAVLSIVAPWAAEDADAAMEWAMALPEHSLRSQAMREVLLRQSFEDPDAALSRLDLLPSPGARQLAAGDVAVGWFGRDKDGAMEWAREQLDGAASVAACDELLGKCAEQMTFEERLDLANRSVGYTSARRGFVGEWAGDDPAAAAEWALQQGDVANYFFDEVAKRWSEDDLEGFKEYRATIEDEAIRSAAQGAIERIEGIEARAQGTR